MSVHAAIPLIVLLFSADAPVVGEGCTCALVMETDGWCEVHSLGYVAGLEIDSYPLFEALDAHGHEFGFATHPCAGCMRASETGGFCDEHRLGFVAGLAYYSRLTYLVAKARAEKGPPPCEACRETVVAGGWCDACGGVGFVGPVVLRDRGEFDEVTRALDLVRRADRVAERCETCAVAIVTDSICPVCKLEYRDGEARPFTPRNPAGGRASETEPGTKYSKPEVR